MDVGNGSVLCLRDDNEIVTGLENVSNKLEIRMVR